MSKDKEMLLNMDQGSDSEEEIEEFKLPPPRKNRRKVQKNRKQLDTRVADGKSPLFTLKCIAMFFLISLVVSGCLLLAFFILNTQTQINELKVSLAKANDKIVSHSIEQSKNYEMLIIELQQVKKSISEMQQSDVTALGKIKALELYQNSSKDNAAVNHQIALLSNDISSLKDGMALAGSDSSKLHDKASENTMLINQLTAKVEEIKEKQGNNVLRPIAVLEESQKDFVTRKELNALIAEHKMFDSKLVNLTVEVDQHMMSNVNEHMQTSSSTDQNETKDQEKDVFSMKFIYELNVVKSLTDSLNISMNKKLGEIDTILYQLSNKTYSHLENYNEEFYRILLEDISRVKSLQVDLAQNMIILKNLSLEVTDLKAECRRKDPSTLLQETVLSPAKSDERTLVTTPEQTTEMPSVTNLLSTISKEIRLNDSFVTDPTDDKLNAFSNNSDFSKVFPLNLSGRPGFLAPFAPKEPGNSPPGDS